MKKSKAIAPVQSRSRAMVDALKLYGVLKWPIDSEPISIAWLGSFFVIGWLECFVKRDWRLMEHYLRQAEQVLFAIEHGADLDGPESTGARRGR